MPSGPDLFDDEDGREPEHRSNSGESDRAPDPSVATRSSSRRSPNYLIRRAVVVGGVVAVLATASIVIGQLMGSNDVDTGSGAVAADWNRLVLVDDRSGRVIVDDAEGEELARIESGVRSPSASAIVDSALVVANDELVAVVDLGNETVEEYDLGAQDIVNPAGSALVMIAPRPDGGRAVLVHGPSGDLIDTDSFAPVVGARYDFAESRSSTSGRDVLVTDAGNFQSVLFSFDREEPSFFAGLALAVSTDLVITAQNVGNNATVSVFDHDGELITTGQTPSVRAGMIADSGIVLVTVEGDLIVMSSSDGEISEAGRVDIGTVESGDVTTSGDRLVVTGASGTAIVDTSAEVVLTLDEQRPTGGGRAPSGSTCMGAVTTGTAESRVSLIDLTDGTLIVETAGSEPVLTDASGCTAATSTSDGFDVIDADGVEQIQTGDTVLAVSLDGTSVAAERSTRVVLLDIGATDDAEQEPVDLGPRGRTVHFTQS
jgi:hypothetical protein